MAKPNNYFGLFVKHTLKTSLLLLQAKISKRLLTFKIMFFNRLSFQLKVKSYQTSNLVFFFNLVNSISLGRKQIINTFEHVLYVISHKYVITCNNVKENKLPGNYCFQSFEDFLEITRTDC